MSSFIPSFFGAMLAAILVMVLYSIIDDHLSSLSASLSAIFHKKEKKEEKFRKEKKKKNKKTCLLIGGAGSGAKTFFESRTWEKNFSDMVFCNSLHDFLHSDNPQYKGLCDFDTVVFWGPSMCVGDKPIMTEFLLHQEIRYKLPLYTLLPDSMADIDEGRVLRKKRRGVWKAYKIHLPEGINTKLATHHSCTPERNKQREMSGKSGKQILLIVDDDVERIAVRTYHRDFPDAVTWDVGGDHFLDIADGDKFDLRIGSENGGVK